MSIHVADWVWHHSIQKGTALLLMLAIADHAHDDGGGAYPSVEALAQKIRMSPRQVKRVVHQLVESGELEVDDNAGPRGCHIYRITMRPGSRPPEGDNLSPPSDDSGSEGHPGATTVTQGQDAPPCHGDMGGTGRGHPGQGGVTSKTPGGDIAMSPEPSVTVIEPSEPSRATRRVPAREQRALFEDGEKTFDEGLGPTPEPPSDDAGPEGHPGATTVTQGQGAPECHGDVKAFKHGDVECRLGCPVCLNPENREPSRGKDAALCVLDGLMADVESDEPVRPVSHRLQVCIDAALDLVVEAEEKEPGQSQSAHRMRSLLQKL